MSKPETRRLSIVTPYKVINADSWPGEMPVEIRHASDIAEYKAQLPGTDVLLSLTFTREMAKATDSLQLIQCAGAGFDNIDLAAVPTGCQVAIAHEHERAIAEWVVMAMIALNREILKADRTLRQGNWEMCPFRSEFSPELAEQTLGIIGLGRIGRQSAVFARALGMRVIAATRTLPAAEELQQLGIVSAKVMDDIGQILSESDFVLLSMPLAETTRGMIGAREIALMKPTAHLINVGRAELVEESALFNALKNKYIKGAALDVWYHEPQNINDKLMPANYPFWELDNVLMAPHLSSLTTGMIKRRLAVCARNIDHLARGEKLENVVHVG
jgi:phosphoglycerate dehydrogenase-like enzyme